MMAILCAVAVVAARERDQTGRNLASPNRRTHTGGVQAARAPLLSNCRTINAVSVASYGTNSLDSSLSKCHDSEKVRSLLRIMIETDIAQIAGSLLRLEELKGLYDDDQMGDDLESDAVVHLSEVINSLYDACIGGQFRNVITTIETAQRWAGPMTRHTKTAAQSEITHIVDAVHHELEQRKFFQLLPGRAEYFDHDGLFGDDVYSAFPFAVADIREAGNCLATGRDTAAVFYLMRTVEWGLRALCGHVGLHQARRPRKSGKQEYIPLAYAEWEIMLNQLQPRVRQELIS